MYIFLRNKNSLTYLAKNDFWRKVFRGTAKGPRPTLHSFCEAEIRNLKIDRFEFWHLIFDKLSVTHLQITMAVDK